MFKVSVIAINHKDESRKTSPLEALVDTGSELTRLPGDALQQADIRPERERSFPPATKQIIKRKVGYAILEAEGYRTIDEVVFGEAGDMTLLGVRTLEGFGVAVDNIGHRFVAQTTIVAGAHIVSHEVLMRLRSVEDITQRIEEAKAKRQAAGGRLGSVS